LTVTIYHNPACGTSRNTGAGAFDLLDNPIPSFVKEDGEAVTRAKG
jgi:hypothetical protein